MATNADVSRLERILNTHLRVCEDAGFCRVQMLWALNRLSLTPFDYTVLLNMAIFLCRDDEAWTERMLKRKYLPPRADETVAY